MKEKRWTIGKLLPWIALAAAYAISVGFFALYGQHNLDSDLSAEMITAQVLNEEGSFTTLTDRWLYPTELRIMSPMLLYQLGLKLFPSWHMARTFAVAIILAINALSLLFMAREAGFGEGAPWLAVMLTLPYCLAYTHIVIYGGYYSMHLAFSFLIFGLVCRYARAHTRRDKLCALVPMALLSLVGGIHGLRLMMMLSVPMTGAAVLLALAEFRNARTLREAAGTQTARLAAASLFSLAVSCIGYLCVNVAVLSKQFSFFTYLNSTIGHLDLGDYLKQIRGVIVEIGLREGIPLLSQAGIACMLTLAYFGLMIFSFVRLVFRWKDIDPAKRLFLLTEALAIALGMTLVILLSQFVVRHYLVGIVMLLSTPLLMWGEEPCKNPLIRTSVYVLFAALFFFQTNVSLRYDYTQGKVNYEFAADWLLEHGYTQGFAGYLNASMLTEASDGQIEVWAFHPWKNNWNDPKLYGISQRTEHLEHDPEGKVFLLVDEAERAADSPLFDDAHLVDFIAWSYYVYEYDSAEQMRALIRPVT